MTDPEDHSDDPGNTRPISVAELLAKNGNIGSPPVGGRRRRKRGNADAVTVAELTGEIPIVREPIAYEDDEENYGPVKTNGSAVTEDAEPGVPVAEQPEEEPATSVESVETRESEDTDDTDDAAAAPDLDEVEADYEAHLERRDVEADPVEFAAPTRRATTRSTSIGLSKPVGGAEGMSPDPFADDDDDDLEPDEDLIRSLEGEEPLSAAEDVRPQGYEVPSYLRSNSDALFGGQSVADDLARRNQQPGPEDIDLGADDRPAGAVDTEEERRPGSPLLRGVWVVAQCLLAVVFGAGLFIAFDLLWKWNNIVALVLSVLVILALVVGVRVVRKTEDVGSTLIAVAVGALVTLGPLALLSSH